MGTKTVVVSGLDQKYLVDDEHFKQNAAKMRKAREAKGEGSMYSTLQPFHRPELSELVGKRIDVFIAFYVKVEGKTEKTFRWCQGKVLEVIEGKRQPTVSVGWDPIPDSDDYNEYNESEQVLLPTKWNKDYEGAWQMDVDIEIENVMDDDNEIDNKISEDENENETEIESSDSEVNDSD